MKRCFLLIITVILCCTFLFGCSSRDDEKSVITGYDHKESFNDSNSNGEQAFTKFIYNKDISHQYSKDKNYVSVNADNKEEIKGYFTDFSDWVKISNFKDDYDFSVDMITDGDCYYVYDEKISDDNIGQRKERRVYKMYSIYYYDVETNILYYIYNDITS